VPPAFADFLESKPLYYKTIDRERIHRAYARIRHDITHPPSIHIVGTNAKGSIGRMIAYLAWKAKGWKGLKGSVDDMGGGAVVVNEKDRFSVGHYSSPHILRFNERIWIDGEEVSDEALEEGHRRLYEMLGNECAGELSYFEYTTLLALLLFESCDLIVMEAGLGGEYDATNVVENRILTVLTPIGYDHQSFLGDTIEDIAATKLRSVRYGSRVLLARQPYPEVYAVAQRIARTKDARLYLDTDIDRINSIKGLGPSLKDRGWSEFLLENADTALEALEILGIESDPWKLKKLELFGRYYPLMPNVRIDVGHNPMAARAVFRAMRQDTVLVYGSLKDKDYTEVLSILKPKIKRAEIVDIKSPRAASVASITEVLDKLEIDWRLFTGELNRYEHYLVFGSFYTVETFLRQIDWKPAF